MAFKNPPAKGFKLKKPVERTREEIDQDYSQQAFQAGHKARMALEFQAEAEAHLERMRAISLEASEWQKKQAAQAAPESQASGAV